MVSSSTKLRHAKALALFIRRCNWPPGTPVTVHRANGETFVTVTEGIPWRSNGGAYVRVVGIPGNTRLDRVTRRGPSGETVEGA